MSATVKTSISLPIHLWDQIKGLKNKSAFIQESLEMFLEKQSFLANAEEKYWSRVEQSIRTGDGEYTSLNPNGEKISDALLEENLWK